MKVICIEKGVYENPVKDGVDLIEGAVYTVLNSKRFYSKIHKKYFSCYKFKEIDYYHAECLFIPLSGLDELQLVNEKELINQ